MPYSAADDIHNTINPNDPDHLFEPIVKYIRRDFPRFSETLTVEGALRIIRLKGIGERVIYFYVIDETGKLTGILATRALLTAKPSTRLSDLMSTNIISIPDTANVLDACEMFLHHKLLAFPVLDDDGRILGVVDAGLFTEETMNFAERKHVDDVFQLIGYGVQQVKGRSPFAVFGYRFPWLIATMISGTICALLTGFYEATLADLLVLAFFMTLVLALGESVSIQSMTVALQNLHVGPPSFRTYVEWLRREGTATALLGLACGATVGTIALVWRGDTAASLVIGMSVLVSVFAAGLIGLSIPTLLHAIHEDSKIASGPVTLAVTDILTIVFYFNIAALIL